VPLHFSPFDLDSVIVAIITGIVSFLVSYATSKATHHSQEASARKDEVEAESEIRTQLAETDRRVGRLSHLLSEEQAQRRQAETRMYESEQERLTMAAYIRAVGHWMGSLCDVLDPRWAKANPKPHLPPEIRQKVEKAALENNLQVRKDK